MNFRKNYLAWLSNNTSILLSIFILPLAILFYISNYTGLSIFADVKATSLIALTLLWSIWGLSSFIMFLFSSKNLSLDIQKRKLSNDKGIQLIRKFDKIRIVHNDDFNSKNFQLVFFNGQVDVGQIPRGYICNLSISELQNFLQGHIEFSLDKKFN